MSRVTAKYLKKFIAGVGLTQVEIAERCGCTPGYIAGQLNGHRRLKGETIRAAHSLAAERVQEVKLLRSIAKTIVEQMEIIGPKDELILTVALLERIADRYFVQPTGRPVTPPK